MSSTLQLLKDHTVQDLFTCFHETSPSTRRMLAFAARVTAGIPGVFESLNLDSALELIKSNANKSDQRYQQFSTSMAKDFCDFFVGLKPPQDIGQRRFVDGGVLDNKPLAHAISALKSEPSTGETHLMYIEPTNSSLHVIDNPKEKSEKPKEPASRPISDATRSVGIRMDEPIRPDLEVAQHLNRVADVIYPEFDQDFLNGLKASSPVNQASQAFHAYSQLRLRQVSRRLASIALTVQGLPVVEALIEEKASLFATHLDVKKEIDTWFVLRKLQFLLRLFKAQKINPLTLKEVQDAYQTQHSAMKNVSSKNILATAHEAEDTNKIPSEALPLDQATVKVWLGRLEFFLVAKVRGVANDLQHFKTHLNDPDIASHWEDCFTNLDMQYFPMLAAIDLDDVLKLEVFRVGTEAATIGQSYLKGIEPKKRIQRRDCRSWQGLP